MWAAPGELVGFLRDPVAEVRYAAALRLLREPADASPFLAAVRVETDHRTRAMLLGCLENRMDQPGVERAVARFLGDPVLGPRAAQALGRLLPTEPGTDVLVVDGLPLEAGVAVAWDGDGPPAYAIRQSTCPSCGGRQRLAGPLDWDHPGGFTGTLTGDCPGCATAGRTVVRVSVSGSEMTWDAVVSKVENLAQPPVP